MQIDTLRVLDRFVGVPLCGICSFFRRLSLPFNREQALPRPRKILIIKLSEMGSTVLAYPALAELKKRCPEAELFFLVFKNNAAIVDVLDLLPAANIIAVDYSSPGQLIKSGFEVLRRLWKEKFDTT